MPRSKEDKQHTAAGGIYSQTQCPACGGFVYDDQLVPAEGGQTLCYECFAKLAVKRSKLRPHEVRVPFIGISLLELLLIIGIIGVLLAVVVRPMMKIKAVGDSHSLEFLVFQSENQDLRGLAFGFVEVGETNWDNLIGNAATAAGISDEDMVEFDEDIADYRKQGSQDAQAGSIIETINAWKDKIKARQTPIPLLDDEPDVDFQELFEQTKP